MHEMRMKLATMHDISKYDEFQKEQIDKMLKRMIEKNFAIQRMVIEN